MTENHECRACGTRYFYCDDCGKYDSYKKIACTEECYKVFYIIATYLNNKDKNLAKDSLSNIGFKKADIAKFIPSVQEALNEILALDVVETANKANVFKPVIKTATAKSEKK